MLYAQYQPWEQAFEQRPRQKITLCSRTPRTSDFIDYTGTVIERKIEIFNNTLHMDNLKENKYHICLLYDYHQLPYRVSGMCARNGDIE